MNRVYLILFALIFSVVGCKQGNKSKESAFTQIENSFSPDFEKKAVKSVMAKTAFWQTKQQLRKKNNDWTNGALYAGMVEWAKIADDTYYFDWLKGIGEQNNWDRIKRKKVYYHADDFCVGQMYTELFRKYKDSAMIKPMVAHLDSILANPSSVSLDFEKTSDDHYQNRWSWCDALFMAPTVWTKLYKETGKKEYLEFMYKEFKATTDFLYDQKEDLYYRDSNFFSKKEKNGKNVFWGRGNGWVFGGLAVILSELPADYEHRAYFVDIYKKMAKKIASLQSEEGYWRASMLDPESYPNPEMSCTGFFTYGLAWGINNGLLEKDKYGPSVRKGWKTMVKSVWPDGKLGWIQPVGASPQSVTAEMTDVYGVGAFLLAGTEIYKMSK
ncbi:hypothetical protein FUAX_04750 [Fulvitalea axinellae]|uniref:Glycoside hydrolase family 88 protein n=1 Tax=Fulvitalea axinellae TaxID=1182444 RepID=A0AAU9CJ85_9BACT|nr:hypothetical protein FUAX_04750 [Fulvitalea axinellae]